MPSSIELYFITQKIDTAFSYFSKERMISTIGKKRNFIIDMENLPHRPKTEAVLYNTSLFIYRVNV